jgi:hypothetical protein
MHFGSGMDKSESATLLVGITFLFQGNIDIGLAKRLYKDLSDARY